MFSKPYNRDLSHKDVSPHATAYSVVVALFSVLYDAWNGCLAT